MRCTSIALLSLVLGGFAETASAQPDNWVWTAREEKQLERLERKAGRQGEFFRLTEGSWFVETAGSARLAADLRVAQSSTYQPIRLVLRALISTTMASAVHGPFFRRAV